VTPGGDRQQQYAAVQGGTRHELSAKANSLSLAP
jgi:hypothetical protein